MTCLPPRPCKSLPLFDHRNTEGAVNLEASRHVGRLLRGCPYSLVKVASTPEINRALVNKGLAQAVTSIAVRDKRAQMVARLPVARAYNSTGKRNVKPVLRGGGRVSTLDTCLLLQADLCNVLLKALHICSRSQARLSHAGQLSFAPKHQGEQDSPELCYRQGSYCNSEHTSGSGSLPGKQAVTTAPLLPNQCRAQLSLLACQTTTGGTLPDFL